MPNYYSQLYETRQGETWDLISLAFYGNPYFIAELVEANPKYSDVLIFNAGEQLKIPIIEDAAPETLPPWKRGV